jgi:hypothetical protein
MRKTNWMGMGLAIVLGLSTDSLAVELEGLSTDLVPTVRDGSPKGEALAQRRRRRPAESAENPYGGERQPANGAEESEGTRSEDPRASSDESGGAGAAETPRAAAPAQSDSMVRSDRLDFDERLIQGQTARSGAVYLFSRPPRDLPELVKLRKSYRPEITRTVVGREPVTVGAPAEEETPRTPARRSGSPPGSTSPAPQAGQTGVSGTAVPPNTATEAVRGDQESAGPATPQGARRPARPARGGRGGRNHGRTR